MDNELQAKLEECQKLKEEYLAGWQRERADFLNYKKGEFERVGEILKYAGESLILKLLPILDNFEIAEKEVRSMNPEETKTEESIKGFLQIKAQIKDFLKNQGVEEIKTIGERFDPNFHEVVEEVEVKPTSAEATAGKPGSAEAAMAGDKESGIIIEEIQKGYKINDRLLRPAKVKVTK